MGVLLRRIQKEATPIDYYPLSDIECEMQAHNPALVGGVLLSTGIAMLSISVVVWGLIMICEIAGLPRRREPG